ncbi:hypothetical protein, variant 3 [Blastomyces dermatitidis ER-3]|uniref:Uncharacterized protein n=1 Tax=Ajellomyces dermatitidis (strain ER-3 / ATCC MYA-2586) TaxID=559297 RepID=A0ABX2VSH4_AJEDR|nr:hypothetical protein, variant 3 [Blastomyces dermatitidis ER-3]OAT00174.1 hypothetical protein, variant 3 [Blastomyces dermatitidis ER-3]
MAIRTRLWPSTPAILHSRTHGNGLCPFNSRTTNGQPLRFAEVVLPDHAGRSSNSLRRHNDSYYWKASCEHASELAPLTKRNLTKLTKRLANRGIYEPSSSTTPWGTTGEEYRSKTITKEFGDPRPYKRTPSPCPPSNAPISRGPEKLCPFSTTLTTHEPHQCTLGIACLLEVDDLNYHRYMATQIAAKAREARLSHVVIESGQGYHSLESLKATSKNSARLLLEKCKLHDLPRLDPMAVLKKIQSPEFWETERRYLENPGCLAKRQTRSVTTMPTSAFPLPSPEPITPEISQYMEQTWPPASIPPVHIGERDVHPNNTLHNPATQRSQMNEKKDAMLPEASNQIGDQMNAHGKRKLVKEARVTGNFSSKHSGNPNTSTSRDGSQSDSSHLPNPTTTQRSTRRNMQQTSGPSNLSRTTKVKRMSHDQQQPASSCKPPVNKPRAEGVSTMPRSQIMHTNPLRSARLSKTDNVGRQTEREHNPAVALGTMKHSNFKKRKIFSKDRG